MQLLAQSEGVVSFTPVFPTSRNLHPGKLERVNRNSTFCQYLLEGLDNDDTIFIVAMTVDQWFYALLKVCAECGTRSLRRSCGIDTYEPRKSQRSAVGAAVLPVSQHDLLSIIWDGAWGLA